MILIFTNTERVYGHGVDNMPKIEKITQVHEDGANFKTFLKFLPFQGYVLNKVKVLRAIRKEKDAEYPIEDISKWVEMLEQAKTTNAVNVNKMSKLEEEMERNDKLTEKVQLLEKSLEDLKLRVGTGIKAPTNIIDAHEKKPSKAMKEEYFRLFGKRVFGGWTAEEVQDKINLKK